MQLGLFLDMRNPEPWRRPWADHYAATLDTVTWADSLGAGSVWLSEHHGFDDGYLPQPLTMAAAVAARTTRVRIGTGILLAALRHPRHVAEEAAIVDLVSNGRLELGIGAGYVLPEYEGFGVPLAERFTRTDAAVAEIRRLYATGEITPPPVRGEVPIWLGYQGPKGARRAGRMGVGLLSLVPDLLEPYRQGLAEAGHDPALARMGGVIDLVVADDPPAVMEAVAPHWMHQQNSYREAAVAGTGREAKLLTLEGLRERIATKGSLPGLAVCTPDDAVALIRSRTEGLPVHHVYLWASVAGMPDALAHRHIELLCSRVAPALADDGGTDR